MHAAGTLTRLCKIYYTVSLLRPSCSVAYVVCPCSVHNILLVETATMSTLVLENKEIEKYSRNRTRKRGDRVRAILQKPVFDYMSVYVHYPIFAIRVGT